MQNRQHSVTEFGKNDEVTGVYRIDPKAEIIKEPASSIKDDPKLPAGEGGSDAPPIKHGLNLLDYREQQLHRTLVFEAKSKELVNLFGLKCLAEFDGKTPTIWSTPSG